MTKRIQCHLQSANHWQSVNRGQPASGEVDRITVLLRVYHLVTGDDTNERLRLAKQMKQVIEDFVSKSSVGDHHYGNFIALGMEVEKQLRSLKATKGWSSVKRVFAKRCHSQGKTNSLQHYRKHGTAASKLPTSQSNYWLEALDPKHRSWGHMPAKYFSQWLLDDATDLGFFDWLEAHRLGESLPQVQYLAPDQRWKYMCVFGDDRLIYRHQPHLGGRGKGNVPLERFTTKGLSTHHSGLHHAIWVCSPSGVFFTNHQVVNVFHHSTFLAGGRVLAAGEWIVADGKILLINRKTGHYAATPGNLYRALLLLQQRVDLSGAAVHIQSFAKDKQPDRFTTAMEFIHKGGKASLCAPMKEANGDIEDVRAKACQECVNSGTVTRKSPAMESAYNEYASID